MNTLCTYIKKGVHTMHALDCSYYQIDNMNFYIL
jgi:hypothetical protein